jgi:glycerol-3-phosphate O-acyltransferase
VRDALDLFVEARLLKLRRGQRGGQKAALRRYEVPASHRLSLEYHKNGILCFFVPSALLASVLLARPEEAIRKEELKAECRALAALLRHQLTHYLLPELDSVLDESLVQLEHSGAVELAGEEVRIKRRHGRELLGLVHSLLRPFLEATALAMQGLEELEGRSVTKKRWLKSVLKTGKKAMGEGRVLYTEALSQHKIQSALKAAAKERLVTLDGEHLRVEDRAALKEARARLARILHGALGHEAEGEAAEGEAGEASSADRRGAPR